MALCVHGGTTLIAPLPAIIVIMEVLSCMILLFCTYHTCIILAGATFNFVHESLNTWLSLNFGTIRAFPFSLLAHSRCQRSVIACHPNSTPLNLKVLLPACLEEYRALIMFFNCSQSSVYQAWSIVLANTVMYMYMCMVWPDHRFSCVVSANLVLHVFLYLVAWADNPEYLVW